MNELQEKINRQKQIKTKCKTTFTCTKHKAGTIRSTLVYRHFLLEDRV